MVLAKALTPVRATGAARASLLAPPPQLPRLVLLVLLLTVVVLSTLGLVGVAEARECKVLKEQLMWKHQNGGFRRIRGTNKWVEFAKDGTPGTQFQERMVEGEQVVIFDPKRELSVLLRGDLAGIQNKGEQNFQKLYDGSWTKAVDCT